MATFDQLSPEKRAIVELVLQQGKTYSELSEMLGMPEPRVRELARDALVELAPVSVRGVEEDWRGQLADYVLGQQSGPEATATKGHLRRSEAGRSWSRSLLDSLEQLYPDGSVPAIPDGERGRAARRPAAAAASGPSESAGAPRGLSTADPVMRRRLLAGAGAAALVLLLAVLLWPIGVLTGDDNSSSTASSDAKPAAAQTTTTPGQPAANGPAGIAIVVDRNGKKQLLVRAAKLAPSGQNEGYYVWLYNSAKDSRSLGGQVTDQQGNYQAVGPFPADYAKYKYIDITKQAIGSSTDITHSGQSVLRGPMPKIQAGKRGTTKKPVAAGQTVLEPPA
ncbi:MAG TPA: anti-sigma factor [Thermoleophilaceae bacterium]|nr:anti-sigma factor [Thermoleophilaceae bacterium]